MNTNTIYSQLLFLKSALEGNGSFKSTYDVIGWLSEQNNNVTVEVSRCSLNKIEGWKYDEVMGRIRHNSGKFFSIDGIAINTSWGEPNSWEQPIINQPEVGFLGIITKEFDGILHFLLQAKIEPGNIKLCQLSPTLQATRSNYMQVHKGQQPHYLSYFQNARPHEILLDQLQSEQGGRFLRKRNRNIIIKIDDEVPLREGFIWLTLAQIKMLMREDNFVNMDTRTVVSGISFGDQNSETIEILKLLLMRGSPNRFQLGFLKSALMARGAKYEIEEIITFITRIKSMIDFELQHVPLKSLNKWVFDEMEIHHEEGRYFKVIAVDVKIGNREITGWSQPMVQPAQEGLCAFIAKEINGLVHFIVQAKFECGNHDMVEFAPTVQCLTGNYRQTSSGSLPFLDAVLNAKRDQILFDVMQSEEGGRFYQEQNRNMIVFIGDDFSEDLPDRYIWMTLNQIHQFLKFNNYLNIQARSLIAALSFI